MLGTFVPFRPPRVDSGAQLPMYARHDRATEVPRRPSSTDAAQLAVYRAFVQQLTEACDAAARGDLEARSRPVPGSDGVPELVALQHSVNRALDVCDAFIRESSAALTSAAEGHFHRQVLLTGLPGAYRQSASDINAARDAMRCSADRVVEARTPGCGWPTSSSPWCWR